MPNRYTINSKCFDEVRAFLIDNHVDARHLVTEDVVLAHCADVEIRLANDESPTICIVASDSKSGIPVSVTVSKSCCDLEMQDLDLIDWPKSRRLSRWTVCTGENG